MREVPTRSRPTAMTRPGIIGRMLDRAIAEIAPGWAERRIAARRLHAVHTQLFDRVQMKAGAFDGAERDRLRGENWLASRLSPDSILTEALSDLRQRAQDLYRKDEYFTGAVEGTVDNVVGLGIRPQAAIRAEGPLAAFIDEPTAERWNDRLETLFREWEPYAGTDNLSLWEIQEQVVRSWLLSGDGLVVMSDVGAADKPVPLSLELMDAEQLATPPGRIDDRSLRHGIERDASRRRIRYHFRRVHPGDMVVYDDQFDAVAAERVCHLYVPNLVGQSRGWPWPWSALVGLKDLKEFTEAKLVSEQVAACFSAFVKTNVDAADFAESQGDATDGAGRRIEDIEPGRIQYLNPGEEIQFGDPARPGDTLGPFIETRLRGVSAALNTPYEILAKNYKGLSYSAGRLALIEGRIGWRRRQKRLTERVLQPIWRRFVREAVIIGAIDMPPDLFNAYERQLTACQWIAPGWPWIDPTKEVAADSEAINQNLATKADCLAARGLDLEETLRQRGRELALERKYGCVPIQKPGAAGAGAGLGAPAGEETVPGEPTNLPSEAPADEPDDVPPEPPVDASSHPRRRPEGGAR